MELHFKIIGALLIVLSLMHIFFPKYFKWKTELNSLSLINRQMMVIHTLFIAILLLLMGLLCITSYVELTTTSLGKKISLGLAVFWGIRLIVQFFGYSSKLWRGKRFETSMHFLFSFFWCYLFAIFTLSFYLNQSSL